MPIGNPITLTDNIATREVSVTATSPGTTFTVAGGYRINQISVFRNGIKLNSLDEFVAADGSTVVLSDSVGIGTELIFKMFDDFKVSDAIVSAASSQTVSGDLSVTGKLHASSFGEVVSTASVTATSFIGDGSQLTGITGTGSGVEVEDSGSTVGTAGTINFGNNLSVTPASAGIVTVTAAGDTLKSRTIVTGTTGSLTNNSIGNIQITGFKSYSLMKVGLSTAAWFRLYTDGTSRTNDAGRSVGDDPSPGSGVVTEVVTTGVSTEQLISPFVMGGNMDDPASTTMYVAIQNTSGTTQTITANLTILQLED